MKKQRGQFFTTNYAYILQGMKIPPRVSVVEPFCGNGDLIPFIQSNAECYDIEPKHPYITERDTLLNPPCYNGKYVVTNPPYLARNKSKDKTLYDKYGLNDLYKIFLRTLIDGHVQGGIIIIPLNFLSSIRESDIRLRKDFLTAFGIERVNVFEEPVFEDTGYTVCSIQFSKKANDSIPLCFYPSKKTLTIDLNDGNNYTIGGEIYRLPTSSNIRVYRLTDENETPSRILLKTMDDTETSQLGLCISSDVYYGKNTSRSYAQIVIDPPITHAEEETLVERFNQFIDDKRRLYYSLFLTCYREKTRKRISFQLAYRIINHLLSSN